MKLAIIRTSYDRKTLEAISSEVVGYTDIDEDEYYKPLVEAFFNKIEKDINIEKTFSATTDSEFLPKRE